MWPSWGYTACRKVRLPMLEPYAGKLACTVLWGGGGGDAASLPDRHYNDSRDFYLFRALLGCQLRRSSGLHHPTRMTGTSKTAFSEDGRLHRNLPWFLGSFPKLLKNRHLRSNPS